MKKIAIIGCGRISYKHVEAVINNASLAELVAVCDVDITKAEKAKKQYEDGIKGSNVKVYENYLDMIQNEDLDIVTIATESGYHAEIAINVMNKGIHVAIEKPMAMTLDEADEIIKVSKENNVKVTVCHQNRFNPVIQKLIEAKNKDGFGKIINGTARILWNRNDDYYKQAPWRGTWKLDGGTLMNQCIHNIDLLRWVVGSDVDTVYAQCDTFLRPIEAEDFGAVLIRFKSGAIGIIEGSACVYPKNLEETLSIFGETGTACIGGLAVNKIETWAFENQDINNMDICEEEVDSVYGSGHTPLIKDFIEAIDSDRQPYITSQDGRNAIEIILSAYESRKTGLPVKIKR